MELEDQEESRQIRSYLLRTLSKRKRSAIEKRLFTEEAFCDRIEAAEDELIDAFLRGELSTGEAKQFESTFMDTPRRKQQVEIARALRGSFLRGKPAASSVIPFRRHGRF